MIVLAPQEIYDDRQKGLSVWRGELKQKQNKTDTQAKYCRMGIQPEMKGGLTPPLFSCNMLNQLTKCLLINFIVLQVISS